MALQGPLPGLLAMGQSPRFAIDGRLCSRTVHPVPSDLARGNKGLAGYVRNAFLQRLPRIVLVIDRESGEVVRRVRSKVDDGTFRFLGLAGGTRRYLVIALDESPVSLNAARFDGISSV